MRLRTLLVDNHGSYALNLLRLIAEVNGTEPVVVTNDDPLQPHADQNQLRKGASRCRLSCPRPPGLTSNVT